jgi:SAM-dependent methyltransferase
VKLEETYRVERAKWDALALEEQPAPEAPAARDFHDHARRCATMPGVVEFLGDLEGKRVLDYGCGLGETAILLARSGAHVTAFDISVGSTQVARERAAHSGLDSPLEVVAAAGERLPFADKSFDVIFGKAILHHLDVHLGWPDLYRVLRTGGKAAFVEPMGMNPVLRFVRARLPYPNKNPRGADRPLNYDEIRGWGREFREFRFREIQLLSMLERGFGFNRRFTLLRRMDDLLLGYVPFLRRYCRYVVLCMVK